MTGATAEILFEELAAEPKDLALFIDLYSGFEDFYRRITGEFLEKALRPGLLARLKEGWRLNAPKAGPTDIKGDWLNLGGETWPPGVTVGLGGWQYGARLIYAQILRNGEAGQKRFEEMRPRCFELVKERFPGQKVESDQRCVWFHYDPSSPYRSWAVKESKEALPLICRELQALKNGAGLPAVEAFSGRYIEDLLALAEIVDSSVAAK